jgi:phosphopantetheine adenylyltransferase/dephospho-CoA kinase
MVWPVLLNRAKEQIQILYEAGYQIVVMEAAILLQAGWDQHVHEVWACIIPPEEVISRLRRKEIYEVMYWYQSHISHLLGTPLMCKC